MAKWWPADLHVIGKNITRFHCLYWPAMLMSAGLPLPKQVFAHGFMYDVSGQRMSKTTGNTEDPDEMADRFGVDGVRYTVLREVPFDRDSNVTLDGFVRRYNADLANDLGNLVNRTVSMTAATSPASLPPVTDATDAADLELRGDRRAGRRALPRRDGRSPPERGAGRDDGPRRRGERLRRGAGAVGARQGRGCAIGSGQVLAVMAEACRIIGHLLAPVAPSGARRIHEQLGMPAAVRRAWGGRAGPGRAAGLGRRPADWRTGAPAPIFPRLELEVAA